MVDLHRADELSEVRHKDILGPSASFVQLYHWIQINYFAEVIPEHRNYSFSL